MYLDLLLLASSKRGSSCTMPIDVTNSAHGTVCKVQPLTIGWGAAENAVGHAGAMPFGRYNTCDRLAMMRDDKDAEKRRMADE